MTWIAYNLRHNPMLKMDDQGWVIIDDLVLMSPPSKKNIYQEIVTTVLHDKKRRFEIVKDRIRATNGHSVLLKNPVMTAITENTFAWVVHGTTQLSWEEIKKSGFLKKMSRDYIHFAMDSVHLRKESQIQIYLYLQMDELLKDGYNLFITTNNVIASYEDIPLKYISSGKRPIT